MHSNGEEECGGQSLSRKRSFFPFGKIWPNNLSRKTSGTGLPDDESTQQQKMSDNNLLHFDDIYSESSKSSENEPPWFNIHNKHQKDIIRASKKGVHDFDSSAIVDTHQNIQKQERDNKINSKNCLGKGKSKNNNKTNSIDQEEFFKIITSPRECKHNVHIIYNPRYARYEGLEGLDRNWKIKMNQQYGVEFSTIPRVAVKGYSSQLPAILELLKKEWIDCNGMEVEGVFRVAPAKDLCEIMKNQLNAGEYAGYRGALDKMKMEQLGPGEGIDFLNPLEFPENYHLELPFDEQNRDEINIDFAHILANLIKIWFRESPTPLFSNFTEEFLSSIKYTTEDDIVNDRIEEIAEPKKSLLFWLFDLMCLVCLNEDKNKMSSKAMAIVMAPNLLLVESENPMVAMEKTALAVDFTQRVLDARLHKYRKLKILPPYQGMRESLGSSKELHLSLTRSDSGSVHNIDVINEGKSRKTIPDLNVIYDEKDDDDNDELFDEEDSSIENLSDIDHFDIQSKEEMIKDIEEGVSKGNTTPPKKDNLDKIISNELEEDSEDTRKVNKIGKEDDSQESQDVNIVKKNTVDGSTIEIDPIQKENQSLC